MDEIYVYLVGMEPGVHEAITPCMDGYTIYLDKNLTREQLEQEYRHAISHIENGDFFDDSLTTSQKELRAHDGYK